jgi:hypothetical protein
MDGSGAQTTESIGPELTATEGGGLHSLVPYSGPDSPGSPASRRTRILRAHTEAVPGPGATGQDRERPQSYRMAWRPQGCRLGRSQPVLKYGKHILF